MLLRARAWCPGGLKLASTSATGDVAIFRVDEPDAPGSMPTYTPEVTLKGAHSDVSPFSYPLDSPNCGNLLSCRLFKRPRVLKCILLNKPEFCLLTQHGKSVNTVRLKGICLLFGWVC